MPVPPGCLHIARLFSSRAFFRLMLKVNGLVSWASPFCIAKADFNYR